MIVIDASVATKLINTQVEESDSALYLVALHIKKEEEIIVPSLLFLEVANALATKTSLDKKLIQEGLQLLYLADFVIYEVKQQDVIEASLLAKEHKTSVYDMIYAIVTKNKKCTLVTSDNKFIERTQFSFTKRLSQVKKGD